MEDHAITAGFIAVSMGLLKLLEKVLQKANGGSLEYKIGVLEKEITGLKDQITKLAVGFYEFREHARIKWAQEEVRDERDEARH